MNYGFLAAIKTKFGLVKNLSLNNINSKERDFIRINFLKLLICFGCLILSTIWLKKIYEVPVYVTDINIWDNGWIPESSTNTHLTVKIDRDYGRSNNFKNNNVLSNDSAASEKNKFSHGISVYGQYYRNSDSLLVLYNRKPSIIRDSVESFIKRYLPKIKSEEYFDSLYKTVYISISGTSRQSAYLIRNNELADPCSYLEPGSYIQNDVGDMNILGGFYRLSELNIGHDSYKEHNVFLSSRKDSACYVYSYLMGDTFERPSILSTMEDVSKIVEKLRFNTFIGKDSCFNPVDSIIFEYNGYMEFSESIYPKPDSVSLSSIIFWDKNKINYILKNNLIFHVHFPDMENIQEAKIFILSMLITMFFGMLGNIIYRIGIYKIWRSKFASYSITLLLIAIFSICAYAILHNAHVNAGEVQNKMESSYIPNPVK